MRNHDEKIKDMCESVLPSTSRKNAREQRRIAHGADRARERAALRGGIGGYRFERMLGDADGRRRNEIGQMVWDRRAADKIAPLVRWARVTVERDPKLRDATPEDVLAHFAALLPDNPIGRHALDHIRWGLRLEEVPWREQYERRRARQRADAANERSRYRHVVVALVEAGRHGDINQAVRRVRHLQFASAERDGKPPARLAQYLAGLHAVDEFVAATERDTRVRAAILRIE